MSSVESSSLICIQLVNNSLLQVKNIHFHFYLNCIKKMNIKIWRECFWWRPVLQERLETLLPMMIPASWHGLAHGRMWCNELPAFQHGSDFLLMQRARSVAVRVRDPFLLRSCSVVWMFIIKGDWSSVSLTVSDGCESRFTSESHSTRYNLPSFSFSFSEYLVSHCSLWERGTACVRMMTCICSTAWRPAKPRTNSHHVFVSAIGNIDIPVFDFLSQLSQESLRSGSSRWSSQHENYSAVTSSLSVWEWVYDVENMHVSVWENKTTKNLIVRFLFDYCLED